MKKAVFFMAACLVAVAAVACKKKGPEKLDLSGGAAHAWLEGRLLDGQGKRMLWFQVFDQKENRAVIESYRGAAGRVDAYPAKINEDRWIWMLVNNRFEIRLIADEKTDEYQKTGKLRDYIRTFDLPGMEKYDGPVLKGGALERFIPKAGAK